jgi:hypothetical protein
MEFAVEAQKLLLPVPGRDPRREQPLLPARGAQRGAQAARGGRARRARASCAWRGEGQAGGAQPRPAQALVNDGFSRRREEAQRDPPDGAAGAEAGHPRRDRLGPRHRRAARGVAAASTRCAPPSALHAGDHALPAPAGLHRARPRARAGAWPFRPCCCGPSVTSARSTPRASSVGRCCASRASKPLPCTWCT